MRILEQPVLKFVSATKACIKPFSIKHSASKNIEEFIQFLDATQLLKKIFSPLFQELDLESTKTIQWNLQPKKIMCSIKDSVLFGKQWKHIWWIKKDIVCKTKFVTIKNTNENIWQANE